MTAPNISRFIIRTTDVLQDMRVNVYEESSPDKVTWFKERFLGDNEIIEQLVHSQTSRVCWTIHRPLRGWYIRLKAPMFPQGVSIPLTPVPLSSPYFADASLSFSSRTNPTPLAETETHEPATRISLTSQDDSSRTSIHSYPPTPTGSQLRLPPSSHSPKIGGPQSQVTHFVLAPSDILTPQNALQQSFFTRALSVLKNHSSAHSNSFTLSRVPLNTPLSPPPPYALNLPAPEASRSNVALMNAASATGAPIAPLHSPLLTFHDRTPVLTVRSLTGLLEINQSEEILLGVDTSFWIAVALAYLEFLEERESYLAAAND
ncbi:hypothetical protein AGABI1DRAFT_115700, partial [Agaricus bisporus var. burnettii JB137-S8]